MCVSAVLMVGYTSRSQGRFWENAISRDRGRG